VELPGIELHPGEQLALVAQLGALPAEDFTADPPAGRRYRMNGFFGPGDAAILSAMIRHLAPRRVVEVGSGFSSAVTLDTNERFMGGQLRCTFVDPNPERLLSLLRPGDRERVSLLDCPVQEVADATFEALEPGDILFIDSSHVIKAGGDVNHLVLDVLPELSPGVHVHFHDVFHPFEYFRAWFERDRKAWSETYLLRALLQHSRRYRVRLFGDYLWRFEKEEVKALFPAMLASRPGSLWLAINEGL
jgi:hypothetical protein